MAHHALYDILMDSIRFDSILCLFNEM